MAFTLRCDVSRDLENVIIKHWTGIYTGNREMVEETLDPDVQVVSHSLVNGRPQPKMTIKGRNKVVDNAMKIYEMVKNIEGFSLNLAVVQEGNEPELLLVGYHQQLVIGTEKPGPEVDSDSRGVEVWVWKEITGDDGQKKIVLASGDIIVLASGDIFEQDRMKEHISNEELKKVKVVPIGTGQQEDEWMSCRLL